MGQNKNFGKYARKLPFARAPSRVSGFPRPQFHFEKTERVGYGEIEVKSVVQCEGGGEHTKEVIG